MNEFVQEIQARFEVLWSNPQRPDLMQIGVRQVNALPLLTWLKSNTGYFILNHFSAVDWIEDGEFQLTYLLTDYAARRSLMVCVRIDRAAPTAESVHHLWPEAVTYEQEMFEMFGISFPGSPRQGVDLLLEGWEDIPPMRRDFDTAAFAEEAFGFRPGRTHTNPRDRVAIAFGQKGFLHDH
ncbi:MAG: NADH-quinone oxidoreductase subunit C [Deltaproteobacteria bacterium]|nr:NADH-quinone oxidoreductase subunit C [Deltaproteobacteria bacterium]